MLRRCEKTHCGDRISLAAHQSNADNRIVVTLLNTGESIAPSHLPHICERFYRADAGRTLEGTVLSICEHIARAHGGALLMESVVGAGTTACVTLPRFAMDDF